MFKYMTTADAGKITRYDPAFISKSLLAFNEHATYTAHREVWKGMDQFDHIPLFIPPSQNALNMEEQISAQAYMFWRIMQIYSYRFMKWDMKIPLFSEAFGLDPVMGKLCDTWQNDLNNWEDNTHIAEGIGEDGSNDIKYVTAFNSAFQQRGYRHMIGAVEDNLLEDFCYPLFVQSSYEGDNDNHTLLVRFVNVMFRSPNDRTVFTLPHDKKIWYENILGKEFDGVL